MPLDFHTLYAQITVAGTSLKEAEDALVEGNEDELYKRLLGAHHNVTSAFVAVDQKRRNDLKQPT